MQRLQRLHVATPVLGATCASTQKTKKENQAGHSPERAVEGQGGSTTLQDVGHFFRRNCRSRGIGRDQNQPRLTTHDLKPTPAWLGG